MNRPRIPFVIPSRSLFSPYRSLSLSVGLMETGPNDLTHKINLGLRIMDREELSAPILVTPLGQHPLILGKTWMNRHQVVLDMATDKVVFVPRRCTHVGAPSNPLPRPTTPLRHPPLPVVPYEIPQESPKMKKAPLNPLIQEVTLDQSLASKASDNAYVVPQRRPPQTPSPRNSHPLSMGSDYRKMDRQRTLIDDAPIPNWRLPASQQQYAPVRMAQVGAASYRLLSKTIGISASPSRTTRLMTSCDPEQPGNPLVKMQSALSDVHTGAAGNYEEASRRISRLRRRLCP